jgi:hypothetical protein
MSQLHLVLEVVGDRDSFVVGLAVNFILSAPIRRESWVKEVNLGLVTSQYRVKLRNGD